MAYDSKSIRALQRPCGFRVSTIVQIWVLISVSILNSSGVQGVSSDISSLMEVVNETYSVNMSDIQATATTSVNYSASVSATPPLPSNCHHVCYCNHSMENATHSVNMTTMSVNSLTPSSVNMSYTTNVTATTPSSVNMSYTASVTATTPSSVNMSYTASVTATTMSYNSSVWPTPSSSISTPFVCPNESCWWEVECWTYSPHVSMTPYNITPGRNTPDSITPSLSSAEPVVESSSAAPTEPPCQSELDCNGDCDGSAIPDCDVCIEGNTNVTSLRDCNNICNGTAQTASCGMCLAPGDDNPALDCNNTCFGSAAVDDCNVCTGGSTGLVANYLMDACGVCNGTNSTCLGCDDVPNSGKTYDACEECDGDGSTCTDIMATVPRTIASCQPSILVIGAGLNKGNSTLCVLYDAVSGDMVGNTTATSRNLTHARCEFQWDNYTAGMYNLTVVIIQSGQPNIETNSSLQVYYYWCADLSLTSVEPNEVLKDELPQYVTLEGSGFFDWIETVCYFGSKSTSDIVYVNNTHLKCKIAAVDVSTHFYLSLSMDGGLERVGNVNLTVYDRAPNVTSARFSDTAAEILINFNKEVDFVSEETCSDFFESVTVAKLGETPDCYMGTTIELEISLGIGASIVVGDNLVFKNNVFKVVGESYSRFLSGSFQVDLPEIPLTPVPQITGPDTLSSCGNLTLSGFQSFGGGGRQLTFQWSLQSPNGGADVIAINNTLGALGGDADRINIPETILTAGKTYVFQLEVANFLKPSTFVRLTHSVEKSAEPVPSLRLSSSYDLDEVYGSHGVSIKVTAIVAPCVNDTKVNFLWTVTCADANAQRKVESSSSFLLTRTQTTISIEKGVLTTGVICTFNVTGSMNYKPSVKSSVAVNIKARPTPLEPAIVGGNRQIGQDSGEIKFDAETQTVDPDESSLNLSCSWTCEDQNHRYCYSAENIVQLIFPPVFKCVIVLQSSHFAPGNTYNISVDISKGSRTASTYVIYSVVPGSPPNVWTGEPRMKTVAHDRVTFKGFYITSRQPVKVEWSCVREQGLAYVDLSSYTPFEMYFAEEESFSYLKLPAGALKKRSKYKFKLTVNDGGEDGMSFIDVEVRSGPTSGSLSVNKNPVQALYEELTMSAPQWTVDADANPLLYSFGELVGHDVIEVWGPPSDISEWTGIMPAGNGPNNTLTLCVIVEDKFGSFAMATYNIRSNPPDAAALNSDALDGLFEDNVQAQLQSGNVDKALSAVTNIVGTVQGSNATSDELKRNVSKKTQEFIRDYVDSAVVDENNAVPLLTTLVKTDAAAVDNIDSSNMAGAAAKILRGLDDPLSDAKVNDFMNWMAVLVGDSPEDKTDDLKANVTVCLFELSENMGAKLQLGDGARESSNAEFGVRIQISTLQDDLPVSSTPGAPTFYPGMSLADQFRAPRKCGGGKTCIGVLVTFLKMNGDLITQDASKQDSGVKIYNSQVFSLDLKDPIDKAKITIQGLVNPITFTFSDIGTIPEGKQAGCKYYDQQNKIWVSVGMTVIGPVNNTLKCQSTHATFFAPSQDAKNATNTTASPVATVAAKLAETDDDHTGAIVGGVIGGIVFIVLVVGGVWWYSKNKDKNTGRVSPESQEHHA